VVWCGVEWGGGGGGRFTCEVGGAPLQAVDAHEVAMPIHVQDAVQQVGGGLKHGGGGVRVLAGLLLRGGRVQLQVVRRGGGGGGAAGDDEVVPLGTHRLVLPACMTTRRFPSG